MGIKQLRLMDAPLDLSALDPSYLSDLQGALVRADFGLFCEAALRPLGQKPAAHHRLLIAKLQAVAEGKTRRLMVCMPPGSAKTTYVSHLFAAWSLAHNPGIQIVGASHTASLAEKNSRRAQLYVRDMGGPLGLRLQTESVESWQTTNRGVYRAVGVGGALTGFRAGLGIIDDPVKDLESVAHVEARDKLWDWYTTVFLTRLIPNSAIVVVMTRWHEDDLGGRLESLQGGMWDILKLPSMAVSTDDPLGRAEGEYLWGDDKYDYAGLMKRAHEEAEINGAMSFWSALYQQNPLPAGGSIFKIVPNELPPYLPAAPLGGQVVRAWDFAATASTGKNNPDWTVGVKLARMPDGRFVVHDVIRFRGGPDEVRARLVSTAIDDGRAVQIGIPQDPGQAGKTQVLDYTRALTGYRVESSPETGDKATRAAPVASQWNVGNVTVVAGDWNKVFTSELAAFPNGTKDDQVDALSRAFSMVGLTRPPMRFNPEALAQFMGN